MSDIYNDMDESTQARARALAAHLEIDVNDVETTFNDEIFDADGGEYMVLTDDEADTIWDEQLESYIDECILPELPEHLQGYFDNEAWKRDARMDGRGHSISSYDGHEYDERDPVTTETFYIYRTN